MRGYGATKTEILRILDARKISNINELLRLTGYGPAKMAKILNRLRDDQCINGAYVIMLTDTGKNILNEINTLNLGGNV